ncbi:MAG: glucosamine-6-phosphate deaminase [Verrucomicrobia bacterium]|nr:glucosamine-6-phosphate deaminase [Verrucomicrobiota bacterium]
MEIIIQPTPEAGGIIAARIIAKLVRTKPDCVLGLATGSTPLATYSELVRMHHDEGLDFSRVTTFNLDEYVGLPHEHSHSYHAFMDEHFFGHVNVPRARIHIPDGMARDVPAECARYEVAISAAGGIDLQLLGIGTDGHIGFNEPSSSLASRTRIKTLTERTRADNARFFGGDLAQVPFHCITMGVGTIMASREVLMLAFGARKAGAVAAAVEGPITAMNPASVLQMHAVAKCVVDEAAAAKLSRRDYYRWVFANKPDWQRIA